MKISKLFHWLYAFLMLLPVFFIGGRCLYVTFNKNAKDSYSQYTQNIMYKISQKSEIIEGVTYNVVFNNDDTQDQYSRRIGFTYISINDFTNFNNYNPNINYSVFMLSKSGSIALYDSTLTNQTYGYIWGTTLNEFLFTSNGYIEGANTTITPGGHSTLMYIALEKGTLDNAFIYSVNSLNDTPLFSWAKTSFLVEPFTYISGLFGIASTNPINTMLSYWLAISIIWLVFDLIMYVPLLVHRWIDKAKLE